MSSKAAVSHRRRGAELDSAILDAGWEQLLEAGYTGFTIDAVAARAQAARSVLYRRWPTRLDLLEAVIRRRGETDIIGVPDTGTLRGDVIAVLTEFSDRRARTMGLFAALLGAYYDEAGMPPAKLREIFVPDGPSIMTQIAECAVARGELAVMPPPRILNLPADLLRHELFMTMAAVPQDTITEIVDDVFLPLVSRR